MIAVAQSQIAQALDALADRAEGPIFLPANLLERGIGGDHPRALHLWRNAGWTAFLGLSNAGVCFPQMRDADSQDWDALPAVLKNLSITGLNGEAAQIARILAALRLDRHPTRLDRIEPCFALALNDLRMPDAARLSIRAPRKAELPLLIDWRAAYRIEIMGDDPAQARDNAVAELPLWLARDSLRLATRDGQPVALTGFNARLPETVQVGGVYVPPTLRGQRLARRALALHLAEARAAGAGRAFLFAASEAAARTYTAIGFVPAGRMRIVIFEQPAEVAPRCGR